MSMQRPSLLVRIKQRPLVFIVCAIAASVLIWTIAMFWLGRAWLSPSVIVLGILLALWALAPAVWMLLGDIRDPNPTLLQRYARGLWLAMGAITVIVSVHAIIRRQLSTWGPGPVDWKIVQEIIGRVIWPVAVLLSLALFRAPLGAFLRALGTRASKIGAFNVSIELASLPEARPLSVSLNELKAQSLFAAQDSSAGLYAAIEDRTPADYVTVNLKGGEEWLTSRLFILAALIARVRPIKRIVFLADPVEEFFGEARPSDVATLLASKYSWLETDYMEAHRLAGLEVNPVRPPEPRNANQVLENYLKKVQIASSPPPPPLNEWVVFEGSYSEHAQWVTKELLLEILGTKLNRYFVKRDPTVNGSASAQRVLLTDADFVAIVDTFGSFGYLIDRYQALDQTVRSELSAM
jgi:hypothetical protein